MNRIQGKPMFKGWLKEAAKEVEGKPGAMVSCRRPLALISPFSCQELSCGLDPTGEILAGSASPF